MKNINYFIILLIFVILFYCVKNVFNKLFKVDKFYENEFINLLKNKNIIICGNSPKFLESFKKVKDIPNKLIIRFNTVLDHINNNDQTDVLFVSQELLNKYPVNDFNKWKQKCNKCKIYYIEEILKNNKILNEINKNTQLNFTSGFTTICYVLNHNPNITLVGFDLPDNYNTQANWFRNNVMYDGHNVTKEKQLLINLINENNTIKKI
jgi:hypothetical protein